MRAQDGAGNTATKTFTVTVDPAAPLVITNQTDQLPTGRVGVFYEAAVFPGGGVPPYRVQRATDLTLSDWTDVLTDAFPPMTLLPEHRAEFYRIVGQ